MGGADVIPGVSGGTMALIVGVYERLVGGISSAVSLGLALVRFRFDEAREHAAEIPWRLVLPLGAGIVGAVVLGARVIPPLMQAFPEQMSGLFLGLVAASLIVPAMRMDRFTLFHGGLVAVFGTAAFALVGLPVFETSTPGLLRVFLSASVSICAMILPGISGAFLLKALGIYEPTLAALSGGEWLYVATFCAGAAAGLGAFAKLLDWLLAHRHDATMAALIGLIAGALRALWPWGGAERALRLPESGEPVGSVLLLVAAGFIGVVALIWWSHAPPEPETAAR
jgi:putative membrane protein